MPQIVVGSDGRTEVSLYYEDFGTGPPVVLVPGWPLTQTSWEEQVRVFVQAGRRVITYDRRGFGRSTRAWSGYDAPTLAEDLHHLLRLLELTDVSLVGFSSGCAEVTHYLAARGEDRIAAVVLAGPIVVAPGDELIADLLASARRHRIPLLDGVLRKFFSVNGECVLDEATRRYHLHLAASAAPQAVSDMVASWLSPSRAPDLAGTAVPTLIVHGECDAFMPYGTSAAVLGRTVPSRRTVLVPTAPHGAPLTHPHQWNSAVLSFLDL
ncbi:alpha/beta fold hydrolase [Streptomyces sp. NBC_01185]|uniref:alpha/beta fold hydrolase n=1 Tax=Streptomyces sp. NBC_01185 TaxID=2903764 RepID=UPI00386A586E|nr:alpha/beta hydrolase [Streptomyces sp. NBC_01185]